MAEFDWNPEKARSNALKHGVTFDEAATAFRDPNGWLIADPDHSTPYEDRWVLIGISARLRLLVVVHVELVAQTIRLVSARKASQQESLGYRNRAR